MLSRRAQRTIVVSGKKGYVQLLPEEQKAIRIEVYFSATNVGETNYYSYEWYKERTLYGRFKIAHGEYTSKEKLVQYQNELVYSEEATLFEVVKRLQCGLQKQYEVNKFLVEGLIKVAAAAQVPLGFGAGSTAFDQIPPQPIEIPGLQMDGLYYNMFPGCAGNLIFQTWYDNDICKDVNGIDLTKDNRGKAPQPASVGKPPSGTDRNVPEPTNSPDGTYSDPTPGSDVPTDTIANPEKQTGIACTLYTLTYAFKSSNPSNPPDIGTETIYGKYGSPQTRNTVEDIYEYGLYHGIGCAGLAGAPLWLRLVGVRGQSNIGAAVARLTIRSINPQ
jgi:hypothetical protein